MAEVLSPTDCNFLFLHPVCTYCIATCSWEAMLVGLEGGSAIHAPKPRQTRLAPATLNLNSIHCKSNIHRMHGSGSFCTKSQFAYHQPAQCSRTPHFLHCFQLCKGTDPRLQARPYQWSGSTDHLVMQTHTHIPRKQWKNTFTLFHTQK